jgi:hypothetical protein
LSRKDKTRPTDIFFQGSSELLRPVAKLRFAFFPDRLASLGSFYASVQEVLLFLSVSKSFKFSLTIQTQGRKWPVTLSVVCGLLFFSEYAVCVLST